FYLLMGGVVCCILFCYLSHRGVLALERERQQQQQELQAEPLVAQ
ncbi:hypothetical protein, partial [Serratia sp. (in: enterobacteria)]